MIRPGVTEHYLGRVSPFGDPWISACSGSPGHFVACHVLHRLLAPRHPPRALCSLTSLSNLPDGKCRGMIGVHHLVITTAKSKFFDLLPITSSLGKVRAPSRAARLVDGSGVQRSAGRWPRTFARGHGSGDSRPALEPTATGIGDSGLVETRRLELLTLSLQRRCSSS